jgi:pimeloyl-ACP methyl ester carboxylesterase
MPRSHAAYPEEFRRQMVELVRAGRSPEELCKVFTSGRRGAASFAASITLLLALSPARTLSTGGHGSTLLLPEPEGCAPIGTRTVLLVDRKRNRDLPVRIWYPAAEGGSQRAPYMDKDTANAFAATLKLQPNFQLNVQTHSEVDAPIAPGGPFPVVLLEHGSGSVPAAYSILSEGLASSDFVVVATNHPGESLIAIFPDGREIRFKPYWPIAGDGRLQALAMGRFAEEVLAPDMRFVLDELGKMNRNDDFWRGHLDLTHVGIVGHSIGGTTAAIVAREEAQVLAAVNLDGPLFPNMGAPGRPFDVRKPFLFIMTGAHAAAPSRGREYVGSASNTYYVEVKGATHRSFTDSSVLEGRFSLNPSLGNAGALRDALRSTEKTRSLVIEFFDKYLRDGLAPDLDLELAVERN